MKIQHGTWNRAGLAAAMIYVACTVYAHHVASRVFKSLLNWTTCRSHRSERYCSRHRSGLDGLVRTTRGVYEQRMDIADKPVNDGNCWRLNTTITPTHPEFVYRGCQTPAEVQKVLWFSRFPVTRFHKEGDVAVVEISDIRFVQTRRDRPPSSRIAFALALTATSCRKAGHEVGILACHSSCAKKNTGRFAVRGWITTWRSSQRPRFRAYPFISSTPDARYGARAKTWIQPNGWREACTRSAATRAVMRNSSKRSAR